MDALKEALEPEKPSREEVIKKLEEHEVLSQDYPKYVCHAIELLKQPTRQWVEWKRTGQSIDATTKYLVKWDDGTIEFGEGADFDWSYSENLPNIVAYMVIEE